MLISGLTGSGIGREIALTLASREARTLICVDINVEAARQTAEMSLSHKAGHLTQLRVVAMHVDVTDKTRVQ